MQVNRLEIAFLQREVCPRPKRIEDLCYYLFTIWSCSLCTNKTSLFDWEKKEIWLWNCDIFNCDILVRRIISTSLRPLDELPCLLILSKHYDFDAHFVTYSNYKRWKIQQKWSSIKIWPDTNHSFYLTFFIGSGGDIWSSSSKLRTPCPVVDGLHGEPTSSFGFEGKVIKVIGLLLSLGNI